MVTGWTQVQRLGGTRLGVWAIKHVVAPLQLSLQRYSGGRLSLTGPAPVLLLTTVGRRTGKPRTVPAFYLREGAKYVVCNVRPPHEHTNPWVLNALANPQVRLTLHGETLDGWARLAEQPEVDRFCQRSCSSGPHTGPFGMQGATFPYSSSRPTGTQRVRRRRKDKESLLVDLANLTDDELLSRRHQAFLRLSEAPGSDPRREVAYEEIKRINRELANRKPPSGGDEKTS